MRIVVLVIRTGATQLDRLGPHLQITNQRPIKPLAAIVKVKSQNGKRQLGLDITGLIQHSSRAFVPYGTALGPRASQVGVSQTPNKITGQTAPAVRYAI